MDDCKFKVGDLIVPLPITDKLYSITNCNMELARVDRVCSDGMIEINVLQHKDSLLEGERFPVNPKYFEKFDEFENIDTQPLVDKLSFDSIL